MSQSLLYQELLSSTTVFCWWFLCSSTTADGVGSDLLEGIGITYKRLALRHEKETVKKALAGGNSLKPEYSMPYLTVSFDLYFIWFFIILFSSCSHERATQNWMPPHASHCNAHLTFSVLQYCSVIRWHVTWHHESHKTLRADWFQTGSISKPTLVYRSWTVAV